MSAREKLASNFVKTFFTESNWLLFAKIVIVASLLPFMVLSFFNRPYYDDYWGASATIKHGIWGAQQLLYQGWTGRYFSSLLLTVTNPLSYEWLDGVRYTPLLFMVIIVGVLYAFINFMLNGTRTRSFSLWLALAGLLIYLYAMPQVFMGFFWYTSAAVYQVGNALVVLTLLASVKVLSATSSKMNKGIWATLALLMSAAAAATNEVALLQLMGVIFFCFLVTVLQKNPAWKWWVLLGATMLIAAIFALIAPGNFVRMEAASDPHAKSIVYALPRTIFTGIEMVTRPVVLTSLLFILVGWLPLGLKVAENESVQIFRVHPVIGLLYLFALTSFCYFPFWWLWAAYSPVRTDNSIVFFFLIGWLAWVQSTLIWLKHREIVIPRLPVWLGNYAMPLFGLILLVRGAVVPACLELGTNARRYDAHITKRLEYLQAHKGEANAELVVEPLIFKKVYSILTDGTGLGAEIMDGPNVRTAQYYGIKSIRATEDDGVLKPEPVQ